MTGNWMMTDDFYFSRPTSKLTGLVCPSETMLEYTVWLEDKFVGYFKKLHKTTDIGGDLLSIMEKECLDQPCDTFDKNILLRLFIRLRIYYCPKFANWQLAASKRKNRKYIKVVHL